MLYKLTTEQSCSYGGTVWGPGVEHTAPGTGDLCTSSWLHAYRDPLLAVMLNPIHANFAAPRLWEVDGNVGLDDGLKVGCARLRTIRELPLPKVTTEQRVRFGLYCALAVYQEPGFVRWANGWLSGSDRTRARAGAAAAAGWSAAARAAEAAAWAAAAAEVARAAMAAAWAAEAAARAAKAAAIDLIALAHRAVEEEPNVHSPLDD